MAVQKSYFDDLIENLQLIIDQITLGEEPIHPQDANFQLDAFRTRLAACLQAVSDAATKLCLAYSPVPLTSVEEAKPLLLALERSSLALVSVYYTLPISYGMTLRKSVTRSVLGMLKAVQSLLHSVGHPRTDKKGSKSHLQATGHTWDYADKFSTLPSDNLAAVIVEVSEVSELICDALQELEEALVNDPKPECDDFDDNIPEDESISACWSDADRLVATAAVGLVKTARACVKKLHNVLASADSHSFESDVNKQLDDLAQRLTNFSPSVDDLVSSLYPPVVLPTVRTNCQRLAITVKSTLNFIKDLQGISCIIVKSMPPSLIMNMYWCTIMAFLLDSWFGGESSSSSGSDTETTWITFLSGAVDHNLEKVQHVINDMYSSE